jgi:HAD superfamily hydrolase (TIGR01450 family)
MEADFSGIKAAVFDLDGTVNYGDKIIPGAKETIDFLRSKGIRILFATNNSGKTRQFLTDKLHRLGIECDVEDVYNSGYVAVRLVEEKGLRNTYVVGSNSFKEELSKVTNIVDEDHADTLVVGIDTRFDYERMTAALRAALRSETIIFCNEDVSYIGEGERIFPGAGAMTGFITNCSGKRPDYIVGKPNTPMFDLISKNTGIPCSEMVMIGDSYRSDVGFARNAGAKCILIGEERDDVVCVPTVRDIQGLMWTH